MSTETVSPAAIVESAISAAATTPIPDTPAPSELPKEEAKVEAKEPDKGLDLDTTKKLALLTKREKAVLEQKKAWESEKTAWEAQKASLEQDAALAKAIKNKDWKTIKEHFDYNDYTKFLLNGEQQSPESLIEKAKAELEAKMEEKISAKERELVESQQKAYEQQQQTLITNFKMQIKEDLTKDFTLGDEAKFQFLSLQSEPEGLVYDVINDYYEKTKSKGEARVLKTAEAAEMVENYLADQFKKTYLKPKKVRSLLEEHIQAQKADAKPGDKPQGAAAQANTLTNGQQAAAPSKEQIQKWDKEASISQAAKLLKFV